MFSLRLNSKWDENRARFGMSLQAAGSMRDQRFSLFKGSELSRGALAPETRRCRNLYCLAERQVEHIAAQMNEGAYFLDGIGALECLYRGMQRLTWQEVVPLVIAGHLHPEQANTFLSMMESSTFIAPTEDWLQEHGCQLNGATVETWGETIRGHLESLKALLREALRRRETIVVGAY